MLSNIRIARMCIWTNRIFRFTETAACCTKSAATRLRTIFKIRKSFFEQNVVLNKAADAKRLAGIVKTERLNVDTEAQYAHTDSPVTFQYGQSSGQANGMTYDHKTGLLNFPSKVKATIYDTKNL